MMKNFIRDIKDDIADIKNGNIKIRFEDYMALLTVIITIYTAFFVILPKLLK